MKLLIISDLHLDWITHGVSRYDELHDVLLTTVVQRARQEEIDAMLCLGDISDPDSGPIVFRAIATVTLLARHLRKFGVEQVWIPGNHDVIEDGSGTTTLTPLSAIADNYIHVHERPGKVVLKDYVTVITLPYTSTSNTYDPAKWVKDSMAGTTGPVIVMGHMTHIPGVIQGEETLEMPRGRAIPFPIEEAKGADLMLNGHFHRQQRTRDGIWIPGSLASLTFAEEKHEPAFLVVEV